MGWLKVLSLLGHAYKDHYWGFYCRLCLCSTISIQPMIKTLRTQQQ